MCVKAHKIKSANSYRNLMIGDANIVSGMQRRQG
jgi:hypothetical protein